MTINDFLQSQPIAVQVPIIMIKKPRKKRSNKKSNKLNIRIFHEIINIKKNYELLKSFNVRKVVFILGNYLRLYVKYNILTK